VPASNFSGTVTVPYTGTRVAELSVEDVHEIYSLRTVLETFAFEQVWPRRDDRFRAELRRRNEALIASIDAGDDRASILNELEFHGLVYEVSGHRLLQRAWRGLRGRLQLYWAAHHRAHGRRGPKRDSHDSYIKAAFGADLEAMRREIADHMRRGVETTERFLRTMPTSSGKPKRGDNS
jgi:DNA-binding GntR family transcriptional regulator